MLPEARVVYGTYGTLDAAGDTAVLLPSHYMADLTGYGFLIGPGKALDPTRLFLVTTEMFGNGRSSSPSNTPEPLHGPRFRAIAIRDDVAASRAVLDALHVRHLRAVIGCQADTIALVLPRTFKKARMQSSLHTHFHLIHTSNDV